MTSFEILTLVISSINLLAVLFGFLFAILQVRSARLEIKAIVEAHRDNHDFQRRMAAQEAINQFNFSTLSAELGVTFGYFEQNTPLELEKILKVFKDDNENRSKLIMLLRYYEGLARGINQGIYDEDVVKAALRRTIMRFSRAFARYIEQRRNELGNPLLWKEFTNLSDKWRSEDTTITARPQTGQLHNFVQNSPPMSKTSQTT